jgi:hypothetical protein
VRDLWGVPVLKSPKITPLRIKPQANYPFKDYKFPGQSAKESANFCHLGVIRATLPLNPTQRGMLQMTFFPIEGHPSGGRLALATAWKAAYNLEQKVR